MWYINENVKRTSFVYNDMKMLNAINYNVSCKKITTISLTFKIRFQHHHKLFMTLVFLMKYEW
jgi:hypothetical protein